MQALTSGGEERTSIAARKKTGSNFSRGGKINKKRRAHTGMIGEMRSLEEDEDEGDE